LIRPPETPAVFIRFVDWQMKQQMNSAFLVFDLVEMQSEKCNSERELNQEVLILVLASMKNFENPLKPRHIFELSRLTGRSVSQFVMLAMTGVFTA
jgi:hypothetical protein